LRIIVFSDTFVPYTSGAVRSLLSFAQEMVRRGHQVRYVVPAYPGQPKDEDGVLRLPSLPVPLYPALRVALPWRPQQVKDWIGLADVFHVHSPFILGLLALWVARRGSVQRPVVFTCHSLYEEYARYLPFLSGFFRRLLRHYTVGYCQRVSLVLAPSHFVQERLREWGVKTAIAVLPTGIDFTLYGRPPGGKRQTLGLSPTAKLLVYAGRLAKEKNLPFLLRAFALACRTVGQPLHLLFIGGGPEEKRLRALAGTLGLAGCVSWSGVLPHAEVVGWLEEADLFVFSSLVETQGLVLLEAMAAGLPVVAVRAPATTELVRDGVDGFLSEEREEQFAAKIKAALQPEVWGRLSRGAREKAAAYDQRVLAQQLEGLYLDLVSR